MALSHAASELLRVETSHIASEDIVVDALARYGVRRLETTLGDPATRAQLLGDGTARWPLHFDDLDELKTLLSTKRCDYQTADGRDLYCTAATPQSSHSVVDKSGLRAVAPTSRDICSRCAVPDAAVLCSHLLHPRVWVSPGLDTADERDFEGALCDMGRPEVLESPRDCRAGGHDCWERVLRDERPVSGELPPLALPDALDGLDSAWRLAMGRKKRLLTLRSTAASAGLGQPVVDRETFRNRVDGLADVIGNLAVDGSTLADTDQGQQGSLNRLAAALRNRGVDAEDAAALVGPFRSVVWLRKTLTHSGTASDAPRAAAELGIDWPPRSWPEAWRRVQHRAIDALRELRRALDEDQA